MDWLIKNHGCEFDFAENNLVQVLLSEFSLSRNENKATLEINFNEKTPTIRRRESKAVIKKAMPSFLKNAKRYQNVLDDVLINHKRDRYVFNDKSFVFRYASGGVLPILIIDNVEYYCFFYRDIEPVGWNIANGGCDSFEELLDPVHTVLRELQEELMIFDFKNDIEYRYTYHSRCSFDLLEFETSRRLWQQKFPEEIFVNYEKHKIPIEWVDGPDTLLVTFGKNETKNISNCFININASDFGIEIDKIAKICASRDYIILDGELINNVLLGSPIGLFKVDRFSKIDKWEQDFLPDMLFYDGIERHPSGLNKIINKYWQRFLENKIRSERHELQWNKKIYKFKLCPVTKSLIQRYDQHIHSNKKKNLIINSQKEEYDIYICYSNTDKQIVKCIKEDLKENGIKYWYDDEQITPIDRIPLMIGEGLEESRRILLCVSKNFLQSTWCKVEYSNFLYNLYQESDKLGIVVLRLEDVKVPNIVRDIKRVDYWNKHEYHRLLDFLKKN